MDSNVMEHMHKIESKYGSASNKNIPETNSDMKWLRKWWLDHKESAIDYQAEAERYLNDDQIADIQELLNQGRSLDYIYKYKGYKKGVVNYLIDSEIVSIPVEIEKLNQSAVKIKHDFNLEKIQSLLDQGKSVNFIKRRTGISKYYLDLAGDLGLLDKTKWRKLRQKASGEHRKHNYQVSKSRANESGAVPFLFEWEKY